jgi:hypothetical protein
MSDHPDATMVVTPRCPQCGDTGTVRVASTELQEWIDADGKMPVMAAFPSLAVDDHVRLVTGIHRDCPLTPYWVRTHEDRATHRLAGTDDGIRGDAPGAFGEEATG